MTMFQYKIIHKILATKVSLFRAEICDNNVCPQCLTDIHSLDHMFLHCPSAIAFWKTFQSWYANKTKQSLKLSNSMILYGFFDNIEHRYAFNHAILIGKFSIYCSCLKHRYAFNHAILIGKFSIYCSCLNDEKLSFDSFLTLLREKLNIQKEIAIRNKTINTF